MMNKTIKTGSNFYNEHLQLKTKDAHFPDIQVISPSATPKRSPHLQSNFSIVLTNHFSFLLLHLRKNHPKSKNVLGINIPDICLFHSGSTYELLYSEGGDIKSFKGKDGIRLSQIYHFFRNRVQKRAIGKDEPSLACFQGRQGATTEQEFLMLSDTDFFITCRKFKNDPFFTKLNYLRNKVGSNGDPIESIYDAETDSSLAGEATEGLMGLKKEIYRGQMSQERYLKYLNTKIALFLTFENNIRLTHAQFFYAKTVEGQYYLVNAKNMVFDNLTFALRERQKRDKVKEEQRNKKLLMTPQKQKRYKSYEGSARIKEIERIMSNQWQNMAAKVRIKTNEVRRREQQKNEQAFRLLFPDVKVGFSQLITQNNFRKTRRSVLNLQPRRSLFKKKNLSVNYKLSMQRRVLTEPTLDDSRVY